MSKFWKQAEEIFATARQSAADDCRMAILVGDRGTIHISAAEGWNLEALRLHHGAATAYEVTRRGGQVRVEARSSKSRCLFEEAGPVRTFLGFADKACVGRNSGGA